LKVTFAAPREVVQPLPAPMIRARGPIKVAAGVVVQDVPPVQRLAHAARTLPTGDWYVQLGAFSNAAVARSGWDQATRRFAVFSGRQPTGTPVAAAKGRLYPLSVGGFSLEAGARLCRDYRTKGG
ncbi:SPOR domain-containing protein, partial [Clostridium perfringens]